jgi:hypothetical protein
MDDKNRTHVSDVADEPLQSDEGDLTLPQGAADEARMDVRRREHSCRTP